MSVSASLWAHLQTALLLLALVGLRPGGWRSAAAPVSAAACLLAAYLPLGPVDLAGHLYPYSGCLSLASLVLLADAVASRFRLDLGLPAADRGAILGGAGVLGLTLYPLALGLGDWDPYALGFNEPLLPAAVALAAGTAWWRGLRPSAVLLVGALWAWLLGLAESGNLWDYLLDPWIALLAVRKGGRVLALRVRKGS